MQEVKEEDQEQECSKTVQNNKCRDLIVVPEITFTWNLTNPLKFPSAEPFRIMYEDLNFWFLSDSTYLEREFNNWLTGDSIWSPQKTQVRADYMNYHSFLLSTTNSVSL